jgi:hypothetical protein
MITEITTEAKMNVKSGIGASLIVVDRVVLVSGVNPGYSSQSFNIGEIEILR